MFAVYAVLSFLTVWLLLVPWHIVLIAFRRFTVAELSQRIGVSSIPLTRKHRIVIHAVSVGEVAAVEPCVREILRIEPETEVVLTTGNSSGLQMASRLQKRHAQIIHVQLLPWDERRMMSSWLRRLHPDLVVIIETELWPNLICECKRQGAPLCIVNGRVYPRDVPRYRLVYRFFQHVFSHVDWIGVQSERERERFLAIGAGSHQIEIMGNVKFDASLPPPSGSEKIDKLLKAVPMLVVGGSTHRPEERWLLESFLELRKDFPGLRLVLAPRRTHRAGSVGHLVRGFGFQSIQWSVLDEAQHSWDVLILDQIGWLPVVYGNTAVVVIGGSFVNHGGHNLLEAAAQRRAVIIGPYIQHFESIVEEFHLADAVMCLKSHHELTSTLHSLLSDPNKQIELGKRASTVLESQRGIARKYALILVKKLEAGSLMAADDRPATPFTQGLHNVFS